MKNSNCSSTAYEFSDFEEFLSSFKNSTKSPELIYLTDSIFHLLLPHDPQTETRFRGNLGLWTIWFLRQWVFRVIRSKKLRIGVENTPPTVAFRYLDTPAHYESLAPIASQVPPDRQLVYGHIKENISDTQQAQPHGLNYALETLKPLVSLAILYKSLQTTREVRRILSRLSCNGKYPSTKGLSARLAEVIIRLKLEQSVLKIKSCPHMAVFLTYELIPESKAWVLWARKSGARVIHVMHGQRLPTYQITQATDLVLLSKADEEWFRERVSDDVRLWTIGHPRLETIHKSVGMPAKDQTNKGLKIAFFSQPSEADYSPELRRADWQILEGLRNRAEVRVRAHPRENSEALLKEMHDAGIDFVTISQSGLEEDLKWCDAVASSWSTVSMEAAACGRGVFWTCAAPENYLASAELRQHGIGVLIDRENAWEAYLNEWEQNREWPEAVRLANNNLQELGMVGDITIPWLERLGVAV